jgi:hypothetical protein
MVPSLLTTSIVFPHLFDQTPAARTGSVVVRAAWPKKFHPDPYYIPIPGKSTLQTASNEELVPCLRRQFHPGWQTIGGTYYMAAQAFVAENGRVPAALAYSVAGLKRS